MESFDHWTKQPGWKEYFLKTDYKEDGALGANAKLAVKIMLKTMDSTTPSPDRIEISELKRNEQGGNGARNAHKRRG